MQVFVATNCFWWNKCLSLPQLQSRRVRSRLQAEVTPVQRRNLFALHVCRLVEEHMPLTAPFVYIVAATMHGERMFHSCCSLVNKITNEGGLLDQHWHDES